MKVFISWSGKSSKAVASALRDWLPVVIQNIKPWMSDEDIEKGTRWQFILDKELSTDVGIFCLTPDNLREPFILFEAGAIAKSVEKAYACTYLFRVKPGDIKGPLSAFQATVATKEDTKKLIKTLNQALKEPLSDKVIETTFENNWPDLEIKLNTIPKESGEQEPTRSNDDKIDEILLTVRNLQSAQNKTQSDEEKIQTAAANLFRIAKTTNALNIMKYGELNPDVTESSSASSQVVDGKRRRHHVIPREFFPDNKPSK